MFQSWRRRFECGPQWKCDKRQGNDYQHIPLSDHIHLFILPPNIQYLSLIELYAKTICFWHTLSLISNQYFRFQENSVEAYEEENYRPKDILANLTIGWSPNKKNHLINSFDFHHQENIQNLLGQYYADDDDDDYSMAGSSLTFNFSLKKPNRGLDTPLYVRCFTSS